MARKPAKMYRQIKGPAYTRRQYTGGVPNNRILRYHMGNRTVVEANGFEVVLNLTVDNSVQFRQQMLKGMLLHIELLEQILACYQLDHLQVF